MRAAAWTFVKKGSLAASCGKSGMSSCAKAPSGSTKSHSRTSRRAPSGFGAAASKNRGVGWSWTRNPKALMSVSVPSTSGRCTASSLAGPPKPRVRYPPHAARTPNSARACSSLYATWMWVSHPIFAECCTNVHTAQLTCRRTHTGQQSQQDQY